MPAAGQCCIKSTKLRDLNSLQKNAQNLAGENTSKLNKTSKIIENLLKTENYGCFCRNLNSKNFTVTENLSEMTQGRPVNHIDEICRDLIHQWSCLLQETAIKNSKYQPTDYEDLSLSANYTLPEKIVDKNKPPSLDLMLKDCNFKNKQRTLKLRNGVTLTQEKSNFTSHLCQIETRFAYFFTSALWGWSDHHSMRDLKTDGLYFDSDDLEGVCSPWKLMRKVGNTKWVHCCTKVKDENGDFSPFRRVYTIDANKSASIC